MDWDSNSYYLLHDPNILHLQTQNLSSFPPNPFQSDVDLSPSTSYSANTNDPWSPMQQQLQQHHWQQQQQQQAHQQQQLHQLQQTTLQHGEYVHPTDLISPLANTSIGRYRHPPQTTTSESVVSQSNNSDEAEHDDDSDSPQSDHDLARNTTQPRRKLTRSSRACTVCRRLKLRCIPSTSSPNGPCRKCAVSHQECIFPESKRGKSSKRTQQELTQTVIKMEQALATVISSLNDPALAALVSGMASPPSSPKPSGSKQLTASDVSALDQSSPPPQTPSPTSQSRALTYLPSDSLNPLGLLAETSLHHRTAIEASNTKSEEAEQDAVDIPQVIRYIARHPEANAPHPIDFEAALRDAPSLGVANASYFKPGPMTLLPVRRLFIERAVQPEMLTFITAEETVELFKIFFEHINPHVPILVPDVHTPSYICSRSPFLLTTICSIAARFCPSLQKHCKRLTKLARKLAFDVPNKGYKSIEIVQAYLYLTLWGYGPAYKYEHDTTWLLLGLAIRTATDLNLHRHVPAAAVNTPQGIETAIEIRNRERTWILCFVMDRSISAQLGKPHTIHEDYIIRNVSTWWHHPVAVVLDAGLAAYAELQRILTRALDLMYSDTDSPSGLSQNCNYLLAIKTAENQLKGLREEWYLYTENYCASQPGDTQLTYWKVIAKLYNYYAELLINSFGLQDAMDRTPINLGHFFTRCYVSASSCVGVVVDELAPLGYLKYSPTSHFVITAYAVLTLLKLSRPEFHELVDCRDEVYALAARASDVLADVAPDPLHPAALYSVFLKTAIEARKEEAGSPSALSDMHDLVSPAVDARKAKRAASEMDHSFMENAEPPLDLGAECRQQPQQPLSFLPAGQPLIPMVH